MAQKTDPERAGLLFEHAELVEEMMMEWREYKATHPDLERAGYLLRTNLLATARAYSEATGESQSRLSADGLPF